MKIEIVSNPNDGKASGVCYVPASTLPNGSTASGYPSFPRRADGSLKEYVGSVGSMMSFDGKTRIGSARIVGSWAVRSYVGSTMFQIEAVIDGMTYTGRGFGSGMIWKGRRKAQ